MATFFTATNTPSPRFSGAIASTLLMIGWVVFGVSGSAEEPAIRADAEKLAVCDRAPRHKAHALTPAREGVHCGGEQNRSKVSAAIHGHAVSAKDGSATKGFGVAGAVHDSGHRFAPSKPMSALHFVTPARYRVNGGETVDISVTILASEPVEDLSVTAHTDPGLILPAHTRRSLGSLSSGQTQTASFSVTALAEGRRYVTIVASAQGADGADMSVYAVPVEVGNLSKARARKPAPDVVFDDEGNRLIVLRAVTPRRNDQPHRSTTD